MKKWSDEHFETNKTQNESQAIFEFGEHVYGVGQQEVHRAQAEYRKNIRGVQNERIIGRNGKNGWDRINGKNEVGRFNDH